MPELPEVETLRIALAESLMQRRIVDVCIYDSRLRVPIVDERVVPALLGRTFHGFRRRAKYLLFDLSDEWVMLLHLGMSGHLSLVPATEPRRNHDHVVFLLDDNRELRFNDPRRFGMLDVFPRLEESGHGRLCHLGVEPFSPAFTGEHMRRQAAGSRRPVKNFLMDATKVVGVGNIYANEILFRARTHPKRHAGRISASRWESLVVATRDVLHRAITLGGTTLRDFSDLDGSRGSNGERLQVYNRSGYRCPRCACEDIRRIVMVGRATFYCPRCQR